MANTTNLDLVKPAGTDKALVSVLNANSDKIDAFAGSTNQALENYTKSNGELKYIQSGDVRTIDTSGRYYIRGTVANLPSSTAHYVDVYVYSTVEGGYKHLVACRQSDGTLFTCNCSAGVWTDWQQLALKSVLDNYIYNVEESATSVPSEEYVTLSSITLSAGTYIVIRGIVWGAKSGGIRRLHRQQGTGRAQYVTSGTNVESTTNQQMVFIERLNGTQTLSILAYQTSGSAVSATPYWVINQIA